MEPWKQQNDVYENINIILSILYRVGLVWRATWENLVGHSKRNDVKQCNYYYYVLKDVSRIGDEQLNYRLKRGWRSMDESLKNKNLGGSFFFNPALSVHLH